jgi:hypothetical protein
MRIATLILCLAFCVPAQADAAKARAALEVALAAKTAAKAKAAKAVKPKTDAERYDDARKRAIDQELPFVAFTGCEASWLADKAVTVQTTLGTEKKPVIVVAFPSGVNLYESERLAPTATPSEIAKAVERARAAARSASKP